MSGKIRIALAQQNFLVGGVEQNLAKIVRCTQLANRQRKVDLVAFPELCLTGYPPEDLLFRRDFLEQSRRALTSLLPTSVNTPLIVGAPRLHGEKLYNSVFYLAGGKIVAHCDKQNLPNYTVFDEKRYFSAGSGHCVTEIADVRCALLICEDLWFPEPVAEIRAAGAEILLSLNASPFHTGKQESREKLLETRASEAQLPLIYVNQTGGQDELVFDGDSCVYDELGLCRFRAPSFEEIVADVLIENGRVAGEALACKRLPDADLLWRALVNGLRDYVLKNGFRKVVLGLSGGIDSALVLVLAADTLGGDNVTAVMMRSRFTSPESQESARQLAENVGVEYHELEIDGIFTAFMSQLKSALGESPVDTTEENLQARIRGSLLMAIANKRHEMLLATGNKSEMAVGYSTLYGDMAGGFAPLKDISKTRVYEMAKYCNRNGERIPEFIIQRAPTAELAEGQLDQDTLPPYETLDAIIEHFVELGVSAENLITQGVTPTTAKRIQKLILASEHKRRQAAPGTKITEQAFGKDRRYPITSGFKP